MNKVMTIVITAVAVLLLAGSFIFYKVYSSKLDAIEDKKSEIKVPSKKTYNEPLKPKDVEHYEDVVNSKLDGFLHNDLDEGVFNGSNSGVSAIRNMFSVAGGRIITKDDSQKKFRDYYKDFDFEVSNVSAQRVSGDDTEIIFNAKTTYKGKEQNPKYDLFSLTVDKNDKL